MTHINKDFLKDKKHIHFIGIGGSGMFPLVQILHGMGYYITGSDNNPGDTIDFERQQMHIPVTIGQSEKNIEGADLIVHTAAIMDDNPELMAARASGVPTIERAELLGLVTSWFSNCVGVCGTHGKTTTTAMLTQMFIECGMDPSAVIGGKLEAIGGSGRLGSSEVMVCEACEFEDHFLKFHPDIAVVLNVDADHMEYFKTMDHVLDSYHRFAAMATKAVIYNGDDANSCRAVQGIEGVKLLSFGMGEDNDYHACNIRHVDGRHTLYDLYYKQERLGQVKLNVPGEHNVLNSMAAVAAAIESGCQTQRAVESVSAFQGAGRRFEIMGTNKGVTIADDYGHHPAEIEVTLKAAKQMGYRQVWAVHQPFTYSRTAMLLDDFARVLQIADHVVLSENMGSREKNTYNIYASDLAKKIPGCVWFPTFEEISQYVMERAQPGDLVITLGCGDVYKCAKLMLHQQ